MFDSYYKILGFIGYSLMVFHYLTNKEEYSIFLLLGYIILTLSFFPEFLNIKIKDINPSELKELIKKIGHLLFAGYYGFGLSNQVDLHSLLGFIANSLFLFEFKNVAFISLAIFYVFSAISGHFNFGIFFLLVYYYYQYINLH